MSHDGSYIVIRDGRARFFYSRWGGLVVDRDLLRGPGSLLRWVETLTEVDSAWCERWLDGLMIADLDARKLDYWARQFAGSDSIGQRLHRRVMEKRWPGWRLRWLAEPARALAERFPDLEDKLDTASGWRPDLEEFLARQEAPWNAAVSEEGELYSEIADQGEQETRWLFEQQTHTTWICVRREDGWLEDSMLDDPEGELLRLGPPALRVLSDRPSELPERVAVHSEEDLSWCYFLDEAKRQLWWWAASPPWSDHPAAALAEAWPGWSSRAMEDGPREVLRETGLGLDAFGTWKRRERALATWTRLLGDRPGGAEILEAAARSLKPGPGERLVITSPGPGDRGPDPEDDGWKAECRAIVQPLLDEL